jgi:hypothetical protein
MKTIKGKGKRLDFAQIAHAVVEAATNEQEDQPEKESIAVESGRRGGLVGGKLRADKLTPERRSEIAKKAAQARWSKNTG